ncbi:rRNA biogenesis protein rrp5 [Smittium culicis]|uniref:rRNA biogenesis protein rrp5 n=1 Tax=Smittium culicis TaxID=133412 RepID=A0A1R1XI37_9FUNG|nr:rRNA biogenesis protein rrp5 [Smittium culicis]
MNFPSKKLATVVGQLPVVKSTENNSTTKSSNGLLPPKKVKPSIEEQDFPRGGSSGLTHIEYKQVAHQADMDLFKEEETTKKAKRKPAIKSTPSKKPKVQSSEPDFDDQVSKAYKSISPLNFRRLIKGDKILGVVSKIDDLGLKISLPDNLVGYVPITQISKELTTLVEDIAQHESADDEDSFQHDDSALDLSSRFYLGQFVKCSITSVSEALKKASKISNSSQDLSKSDKSIELSLEPEIVNKGLLVGDISTGMVLSASISSIEDHGYVLNIGINGVNGFLPFSQASEFTNSNFSHINNSSHDQTEPQKLNIGQVILVSVSLDNKDLGSAKSSQIRVINFTADPKTVSKAQVVDTIGNIHSIQPGSIVNALITSIGEKGATLQFMGFYDAIAPISNLRTTTATDPNEILAKIKMGNNIKVRITYVSLSTDSKQIMVSSSPHITNLSIPKHQYSTIIDSPTDLIDSPDHWWPLKYGSIADSIVNRTDDKRGVYSTIKNSSNQSLFSFTTLNNTTDAASDSSNPISLSKFKVGSIVKSRVIGFSPMDNTIITTFKKSVVDEPLFQLSDLSKAQIIKSTIENITPTGIFVRVSPFLTGLVPLDHLSDIKLSSIERRFKVGDVVKSQILNINYARKKFTVTFRKSFVESKLLPLISYDQSSVNKITNGIVLNVKEKGAIIGFYQGITGYLPINEINTKFVSDINEFLRLGMSIKVRITSIEPNSKKVYCSLIIDPSAQKKSSSKNEVENTEAAHVGKVYDESTVEFINEANIGLVLSPDNIKATLNIGHLSDHLGNLVERIKNILSAGSKLGIPVVVIENRSTGVIVSAKPLLVHSSRTNSLVKSFDDCKVGMVVAGFVTHTTNFGVFVKFFNGFSGLANINSISDNYISSIESEFQPDQTVLAKVVSVNPNKKTINLSLKPSQVNSSSDDSSNDSVSNTANTIFVNQLFGTERKILQSKSDSSLLKLYNIYGATLGECMNIKIDQILSYGWTAKLDNKEKSNSLQNPSGFVSLDHITKNTNDASTKSAEQKSGSVLNAKAIDTDYFKKVIDFSAKTSLAGASKIKDKKKKEIHNKLTELSVSKTEVEVIVELVKEDHLVLSVPSCNNSLVYACSKSLNFREKPFNRYKIGQRLRGQVLVDEDQSRVLCVINPKKEDNSLASVNRIVNNPVDPSVRYFEDYQPGKVTKAKVISISKNKLHANLELADGIKSRLVSNELIGTYSGNENIFTGCNITPGNIIPVVILGAYVSKNAEYLPITRRISPSKAILDLSVENSTAADQRSMKIADIKPNMEINCIVASVDNARNGGIWVQINNNLKAKVPVSSITNDFDSLKNLPAKFLVGSPIQVKITNSNAKKVFIDAILSDDEYSKRQVSKPISSAKSLKVGSIVGGYLNKFDSKFGIEAAISCYSSGKTSSVIGKISLVDISDDYKSISSFVKRVSSANNLIQVKVISLDSSAKRIELSSRPSVIENRSDNVVDPLVSEISDLVVGQKVSGFITVVNTNGAFVLIGSNRLSGRVKLSEMSKEYIKSPETAFKPGTIVKTTVLSVDSKNKKVELSMIASSDSKPLAEGSIVKGNVTKINDSGLFITIYDNSKRKRILCLCPIGEIAEVNDQTPKDLLSHYNIGDKVIAKIVKVDDKSKITLSLKSSHFINSDGEKLVTEDLELQAPDFNELSDAENSDAESDQMDVDDDETNINSENEDVDMGEEDESDESDEEDEEEEEEVSASNKPTLNISSGFSWENDVEDEDEGMISDDGSDEESSEFKKSDGLKIKKKSNVVDDITGDILDKQPTTVEEFERLLVSSPNSSFVWVSYMAFYCDLGEIEMARKVCERGLDKISFRMEKEKMNLYVASLNLEYKFGNKETLKSALDKALTYMNQKHIYIQLASIYSANNDNDLCLDTFITMSKKFKTSAKVWIKYYEFCLKTQKESNEIMKRSLICLPKRKHIKVISKYATLSFKYNQQEVARTIFENLISNYPNRTDLWNVYLDLETKNLKTLGSTSETDISLVRNLFTRVTSLKFNARNMKLFFKKWLGFENNFGTENNVNDVKRRAMEYVQSL